MPLISVILPVYNSELHIKAAVDSVLQQTFTDFELFVFNDASTDTTGKILEQYTDPRVKIYTTASNKGYLYHLNEGLKLSRGQFIARMDADDISHLDRFEKQVNFLQSSPDITLVGATVTLLEDTQLTNKDWRYPLTPQAVNARLLFSTSHAHPVVMFRRELFDNGDYYYDEAYYSTEDYELWARLSEKHKLANIEEPLLQYRITGTQTSSVKKTQQRKLESEIRNRYVEKFRKFTSPCEKEIFSNTWQRAFDVDARDIITTLEVYKDIYDLGKEELFTAEIVGRIKEIILANYKKSEQLINWYQRSTMGMKDPLKMKEVLKNKVFHRVINYANGKKAD